MGHTISEWADRVATLIRDDQEIDIPNSFVRELGVFPAIAQFSIDHPRTTAIDVPSSGRYVPLPTVAQGWQEGWSEIRQVEAPAGKTPPAVLLDSGWQTVRDPSTPTVQRILIPADVENEQVRVIYTAAWPIPTDDPATDLIPELGFSAVCSLAAAMSCTALASEAARDRQGAMPSDFVDGADRARDLLDAATAFRTLYLTFIGLGAVGAQASTSSREIRSSSVRGATKRLAERAVSTWPFYVR
jgi:hypothetical protein